MARAAIYGSLAVVASLMCQSGAQTPSRDGAARAPVVAITLDGELDHAAQIDDLRQALAASKDGGTRLIGVEITGARWRYDLVKSLAELVATHEPPVAVFTPDGSLALAMGAAKAGAGCWAPEGSLGTTGDDNVVEFSTTPKVINDAAKAWVAHDPWSALGLHAPLRAAIQDPRKHCWLLETDKGLLQTSDTDPKSTTKPTAEKSPRRIVALHDTAKQRVEVSTKDAIALGLLAGEAQDLRAVLTAAAKKMSIDRTEVRKTRTCGTPLDQRHAAMVALFESIDPILDQANREQRMKVDDTTIAPATKNAAGRQSLATIARASAAIDTIESTLERAPEILRLPAPGQTTTVKARTAYASSWRSQIQSTRERRDKLQNHAEKLRDAR
jgi:hypothetical protein